MFDNFMANINLIYHYYCILSLCLLWSCCVFFSILNLVLAASRIGTGTKPAPVMNMNMENVFIFDLCFLDYSLIVLWAWIQQ